MKRLLILALLPLATGAGACCLPDGPEVGDIGPGSEVVCRELERRFPGSGLEITGRTIQSASDVSVSALVDGQPMSVRYHLTGFAWQVANPGGR